MTELIALLLQLKVASCSNHHCDIVVRVPAVYCWPSVDWPFTCKTDDMHH